MAVELLAGEGGGLAAGLATGVLEQEVGGERREATEWARAGEETACLMEAGLELGARPREGLSALEGVSLFDCRNLEPLHIPPRPKSYNIIKLSSGLHQKEDLCHYAAAGSRRPTQIPGITVISMQLTKISVQSCL
jgi:hypothetical protein